MAVITKSPATVEQLLWEYRHACVNKREMAQWMLSTRDNPNARIAYDILYDKGEIASLANNYYDCCLLCTCQVHTRVERESVACGFNRAHTVQVVLAERNT